ncbi:hypothetical protein G9A89_006437 [Geosiphon pyriformis]|nr:hypothetical protein G9A89_006437 [Geosiphon pyriformis]
MMKAVHKRLLVVVRKRLYNRCYPGVLCLLCGGVEFSDHAFTCVHESNIHNEILVEASTHWSAVAGVFDCSLSAVLWVLSQCSIDVGLYALICKGHWVVMEKAGLVQDSDVVSGLFHGVSSLLSDGVVRLLSVAEFFAVSFGHQKPYGFFSGLGGSVQVIIGV